MTIDFKAIGEIRFPSYLGIAGECFSSVTAAVNGAMRNATFAMRWRQDSRFAMEHLDTDGITVGINIRFFC